ncbi:alpha/beta hydrolase [Streptomyces sp. V1I1]|uniref:alpha/beta hydrolase n=1 Tax=Streptomyces sp. V1I1 TaxID=3042272 RepID=UPI0027843FE2|nr:alpha/beta hydrolase [Streptomyces sp. V1I1]MDQ0940928.1 pimeloyl-ACP methyl ester carboxylesterase [Streptomyces sp. V1I1]
MTMRVRAGTLAAAALLLAGAAVGCNSGTDKADSDGKNTAKPSASEAAPGKAAPSKPGEQALPAALTGQQLDWKRCKAPVKARGSYAQTPGKEWQCALLKAPLDYQKPTGETIGIALIRAKALDADKRIGSLIFNFGGPGGSGVAGLPGSADGFKKLHSRYDLVSFDPRGVAESAAVVCRDSKQSAASFRLDFTPDTPAEEKAYLEDSTAFGAGCAKKSGKVLPHVGTANAARDMDLIRQVLGDDKLYYLGFSYGTELGGVYAHLFPARVGRLVLDAVVDPSADYPGHSRNQALGFQRALENYFKSRGISAKDGTARVVKLLDKLDRKPLPTKQGRTLTQSLALTGIITPLYSKDEWQYLTKALDEADRGDGSRLLLMAESYNGRDEDGSYSTQDHSQRAISCADTTGRVTAAEVKSRHLAEFTQVSPVFGPYLAWDLTGWCANWPVPGEWETPEVAAEGAAPILVVGTTGDPATPYEGAKKMADELGAGVGVLLTNKGEGHGAYGNGACVTGTVDAYLLDGKVPANGKTCG